MSGDIFEEILALLISKNIPISQFRVLEHAPEGKSEQVASIRGTTLEQGAKAIVLQGRPNGISRKEKGKSLYYLAVLCSNKRIDLESVAKQLNLEKVTFAASAKAQELTNCVMGSVPPLVTQSMILKGNQLILDKNFVAVNKDRFIAFNAGRLDRSILLSFQSYLDVIDISPSEQILQLEM